MSRNAYIRFLCVVTMTLIAVCFIGDRADAHVIFLRVEPPRTDPAISTVHGANIALYDPQSISRHQLFLFIVGTGAKASDSRGIDTIFARWGYHANNPFYPADCQTAHRSPGGRSYQIFPCPGPGRKYAPRWS